MVDTRELILARLLVVLEGIEGVYVYSDGPKAVRRNVDDVPGQQRPAIILLDGAEEIDSNTTARRRGNWRMELAPVVAILVGADAPNSGPLLSMFRARVITAVVTDTDLWELVGTSGEVDFTGVDRVPATPESREARLEINFVFRYLLKLSDLAV